MSTDMYIIILLPTASFKASSWFDRTAFFVKTSGRTSSHFLYASTMPNGSFCGGSQDLLSITARSALEQASWCKFEHYKKNTPDHRDDSFKNQGVILQLFINFGYFQFLGCSGRAAHRKTMLC